MKIQEAQILFTRKCNNNCSYCGLTHRDLKELTKKEWEIVIYNLDKLGIRYLKILGGEPMIKPRKVIDLIKFIKKNTSITVTLASNSRWSDRYLEELCVSGLDVYATTLNTFKRSSSIDMPDFLKSQAAYKKLLKIRNRIKKVYVDVVVSSKNLDSLVETVETLVKNDIPVYLFPIICGKCNTEYEARVENTEFKLKKKDKEKLDKIMKHLIKIKREGALILNTEYYLKNMVKHGLEGGTWKCKEPTELRVDSDGAIMLCNDIRGKISEDLNLNKKLIDDSEEWWKNYYKKWFLERDKIDCQCYWPCFLNSTSNLITE